VRVTQLWRYPVKSMLGEELNEIHLGPEGISGDRVRAVVDRASGVSLSAKRYGELLSCRATTMGGEVVIRFSDGEEFGADSPSVAEKLSAILNRSVRVAAADGGVIRHEFPTEIGTGEGAPFVHEPGLGAFFDRAPLHLLSSATLAELQRLKPDSQFAVSRFRPNIVVSVNATGFVEDDWVGSTLRVGSADLVVLDRKPRCVMTTRPQGDLPKDPDVLRTVAQSNGGNVGIELTANGPATIRVGDAVHVAD
jgi:uncharacterized protein YcbX